MKNLTRIAFALMAAALLICSCNGNNKEGLRTGDIVFVALPADYSLDDSLAGAIADATGDSTGLNYIHAAIAEVGRDTTWIIDATIKHGVARYPIEEFIEDFTLRDGSYPVFDVRRLKDDRNAKQYVENAKKYIGRAYDSAFLPDNDDMYCTELVQRSYLDKDGKPIFDSVAMNFKNDDGEFPLYWQQLFEKLGREIPQGVEGTNPQDMQLSALLEPVDIDITAIENGKK